MNDLWTRAAFPLRNVPFEHVCVEDFLPEELFRMLAETFPTCPPASGPTGFTIHAGDATFDALMQQNPHWAAFWRACDSQAFVDFALRQFAATFARDAVVNLDQARHAAHRESRTEKENRAPLRTNLAPDDLFVRFDLMQGRVGYDRGVHVDHRRRAATLLLYFTDGATSGGDGGDLLLHGADGRTHAIAPRANRMAMFPCHNASWHSVSRIVRQSHPRNFLQLTLSSSVDLWEPMPARFGTRLRQGLRAMAGMR